MAEYFFDLGQDDQREVLESARAETERPTHLLEKDVWVVWTLRALFESPLSIDLTFKGGTSLSKVYKIINWPLALTARPFGELIRSRDESDDFGAALGFIERFDRQYAREGPADDFTTLIFVRVWLFRAERLLDFAHRALFKISNLNIE